VAKTGKTVRISDANANHARILFLSYMGEDRLGTKEGARKKREGLEKKNKVALTMKKNLGCGKRKKIGGRVDQKVESSPSPPTWRVARSKAHKVRKRGGEAAGAGVLWDCFDQRAGIEEGKKIEKELANWAQKRFSEKKYGTVPGNRALGGRKENPSVPSNKN